MDHASIAYRLGEHLIVVAAHGDGAGHFVASGHRAAGAEQFEVLQLADGSPFQVVAGSAWEARLKFVSRLEGYLKSRAYEERDPRVDVSPDAVTGDWRLPA